MNTNNPPEETQSPAEKAQRIGWKAILRFAIYILLMPLVLFLAAGTLDSHDDDVEFLAHARKHHFRFRLGTLVGIDRKKKRVELEAIHDDRGEEVAALRQVPYDTLVLAVGSVSNDFGVPGVRNHCMFLDDRAQADRFQRRLLNRYLRAQTADSPPGEEGLTVAIVGAGATGVELAAELHHVARRLVAYGFDRIDPDRDVRLVLVEAAPRILPAAPERVSELATKELKRLGVTVLTDTQVTEVKPEELVMGEGFSVPFTLSVWAAGIRAPGVLGRAGLEINARGQVRVDGTLRTVTDPDVFAFGDCAAFTTADGKTLPPTAQAAHQQALRLAGSLAERLAGRAPLAFTYRDYGSMVSLSSYTAIGNLMGNLLGRVSGSIMFEGILARFTYRLLYRKHQLALYGPISTALRIVGDWVSRKGRSRLKLH